jgi:hypothetical protein
MDLCDGSLEDALGDRLDIRRRESRDAVSAAIDRSARRWTGLTERRVVTGWGELVAPEPAAAVAPARPGDRRVAERLVSAGSR